MESSYHLQVMEFLVQPLHSLIISATIFLDRETSEQTSSQFKQKRGKMQEFSNIFIE